jgi:hypothetical protein
MRKREEEGEEEDPCDAYVAMTEQKLLNQDA